MSEAVQGGARRHSTRVSK